MVVLEPGQSLQWVNAMDNDLRRYLQNRHEGNSISPFYYMIATPSVPDFIYVPPVRVGPAGNIVLGEARAQHPADMDTPEAQAIRRAQEATLDAQVAARRARDYVAAARLRELQGQLHESSEEEGEIWAVPYGETPPTPSTASSDHEDLPPREQASLVVQNEPAFANAVELPPSFLRATPALTDEVETHWSLLAGNATDEQQWNVGAAMIARLNTLGHLEALRPIIDDLDHHYMEYFTRSWHPSSVVRINHALACIRMVLRVHPHPMRSPVTTNPSRYFCLPSTAVAPSPPGYRSRQTSEFVPYPESSQPLRPPQRGTLLPFRGSLPSMRRCPTCNRSSLRDANSCRHCSQPFIPDDPPSNLKPHREPDPDDDDYGNAPSSRHMPFNGPVQSSRTSNIPRPAPDSTRSSKRGSANTYHTRMVYDDEEAAYQAAYDDEYHRSPSPELKPSQARPTVLPSPQIQSPVSIHPSVERVGGGGKRSRGAAQPKPQVPLGHLLMMVATGEVANPSSGTSELRDPWSQPLLETPPEELEECLGAYVDMDDFFTKSHEELYEVFLNLLNTHVDQDFANATPILALLRTKKAREVLGFTRHIKI